MTHIDKNCLINTWLLSPSINACLLIPCNTVIYVIMNHFAEKLRDEWLVYEEDYEKLNQWIKDTETDMKAESDQKATLEEKSIQLEKQQVGQGH